MKTMKYESDAAAHAAVMSHESTVLGLVQAFIALVVVSVLMSLLTGCGGTSYRMNNNMFSQQISPNGMYLQNSRVHVDPLNNQSVQTVQPNPMNAQIEQSTEDCIRGYRYTRIDDNTYVRERVPVTTDVVAQCHNSMRYGQPMRNVTGQPLPPPPVVDVNGVPVVPMGGNNMGMMPGTMNPYGVGMVPPVGYIQPGTNVPMYTGVR